MKTPTALPTLCWTPLSLIHKEPYAAIARTAPSPGADHAFSNLYLWNDLYHHSLAFLGDRVAVRFGAIGDYQYLFPIGTGDLHPAIDALLSAERSLRLVALTEQELTELLEAYPDTFEVTETRDIADYLYGAESLATLAGKKLHGKRNHINAFSAAHQWSVAPLTPADFDTCRSILAAWGAEHEGDSVENERIAAERAFGAFERLELQGALLTADGSPVAFTAGSMITQDTLCVHFEKALPAFGGAYPVINREFVRLMRESFPSLTTGNREDDMGLANLRAAKLSYRPTALLRKFTAVASMR